MIVKIRDFLIFQSMASSLLYDDDNPLKGLLIFSKGVDRDENIEQKLFNA